jgi:hypothetical protein
MRPPSILNGAFRELLEVVEIISGAALKPNILKKDDIERFTQNALDRIKALRQQCLRVEERATSLLGDSIAMRERPYQEFAYFRVLVAARDAIARDSVTDDLKKAVQALDGVTEKADA